MKKYMSLMLALLLAAATPMAALAKESEALKPFEGLVTEIIDGGFLMEDVEMGQLLVNVDDNTVLDGILSIQPIEVGLYVIVDHNGMMTRSIPPQVYAQRVGCYTLNGTAGEIADDGVLLTGDPVFGDVFVQMTPTMVTVFTGTPMLVYYDGVITMSLPGKVNARYVVTPQVTGVISEKDGAGFTLTDDEGNIFRILTSDSLLVGQLAENQEEALPGSQLVDEASMVTDAPVEAADAENNQLADEEAAESGDDGESLDTADASETDADKAEPVSEDAPATDEPATNGEAETTDDASPAVEWGDGDRVTVYHQGPLTPEPGADLTALGMVVHR